MKKTAKIITLFCLVSLLIIGFYLKNKTKKTPQKESPQNVNKEENIPQRLLSYKLNKDCTIELKTDDKTIPIKTEYSKSESKVDCSKNSNLVLAKISPSQKYFIYTDLSGGLDTALKIYSGKYQEVVSLIVLGNKDLLSLEYLPKDYIVFLQAYKNQNPQEARIGIINLAKIFENYSQNLNKKLKTIQNIQNFTTYINLEPNQNLKYTKIQLKNGFLNILGQDKQGKTKVVQGIPFNSLTK